MEAFERSVRIVNRLGLHLRAAAALVQTANRFKSRILIKKEHSTVDAKSIMGVMSLGAILGTSIVLRAEGTDANAALDALERLFADKFGEPE